MNVKRNEKVKIIIVKNGNQVQYILTNHNEKLVSDR
jgi:hypothetical protein